VFGIIITLAFLSIFLFRKILKQYFFIFKNLFLTLVHQNDSKTLKKFNLKQKKSNFNKKKLKLILKHQSHSCFSLDTEVVNIGSCDGQKRML
jgi:hypothetical protein